MSKLSYYKTIVKKIFLLSLIFSQTVDGKAQGRFGIIAGGGRSSISKIQGSIEDSKRYSPRTFFSGGFTAGFPIGENGFSISAEAIYNKKGYDYGLQNSVGANNTLKDSGFIQDLNYVDVNLLLLKKFSLDENTGLFIGAGPVMSVFISGKEETTMSYFGNSLPSTKTTKTKLQTGTSAGDYKRIFPGISLLAGFEYKRISLRVNYNIPLDYYYLDARKKLQHSMKTFGVSVGYALFTGKQPEREKKEKKVKEVKEKKERTLKPEPVKIDSLADTDGDGITDVNDKCPGHKGSAKYGGCPVPDSDGDGVNDDADKCPLVEGPVTNYGCPEFKEPEVPVSKDTMRFTIYFEQAKSELKTNGFNTLSEVVKLMKANPRLMAQFNGHTDTHGSVEANSIRAFSRASVCADYVASFFIERTRLIVAAYSNKAPAADLRDPSVQWKNRRVEVILYEK